MKEDEMGGTRSTHTSDEMESVIGRDHLGDLGVDGRVNMKVSVRKVGRGLRTSYSCGAMADFCEHDNET
jgi:hypothetical protein